MKNILTFTVSLLLLATSGCAQIGGVGFWAPPQIPCPTINQTPGANFTMYRIDGSGVWLRDSYGRTIGPYPNSILEANFSYGAPVLSPPPIRKIPATSNIFPIPTLNYQELPGAVVVNYFGPDSRCIPISQSAYTMAPGVSQSDTPIEITYGSGKVVYSIGTSPDKENIHIVRSYTSENYYSEIVGTIPIPVSNYEFYDARMEYVGSFGSVGVNTPQIFIAMLVVHKNYDSGTHRRRVGVYKFTPNYSGGIALTAVEDFDLFYTEDLIYPLHLRTSFSVENDFYFVHDGDRDVWLRRYNLNGSASRHSFPYAATGYFRMVATPAQDYAYGLHTLGNKLYMLRFNSASRTFTQIN